MKRLLQAALAMAACFALAPFVSADDHGRDRDRDEHHDRGRHYAYGHHRHHRDWDRDRDHGRDWDHDRRSDWREHHRYRRPVPTPVANNRVPSPNAGTPAKHHFPLPNVPRSGAGGTPVANNKAPSPNAGAPAKHHFPLPKAGAGAHRD